MKTKEYIANALDADVDDVKYDAEMMVFRINVYSAMLSRVNKVVKHLEIEDSQVEMETDGGIEIRFHCMDGDYP